MNTKGSSELWPSNNSITQRHWQEEGRLWRGPHYLSRKRAKFSSYRVGSKSYQEIYESKKQRVLFFSMSSRRQVDFEWSSSKNFAIFYLSLLRQAAMGIFRPQFPGLHIQRNLRTGKMQAGLKEILSFLSSQLPLFPHGLSPTLSSSA